MNLLFFYPMTLFCFPFVFGHFCLKPLFGLKRTPVYAIIDTKYTKETGGSSMNHKTVKTLQGVAFFLQLAVILLTVVMTIGQKTVKAWSTRESEILELHTVPIDTFIQVILILILYGIGLFIITKTSLCGTKEKTVVLLTVSIVIRIFLPFASMLFNRIYATTQGVYAFASYTALTSTISLVISPIQLVAFTLSCLSLGGYYGVEKREGTN